MGRPKREESTAENRKTRVPLGVLHQKLSVPSELIPPDYVGRWIVDEGSRIMMAQQGGYEFVPNDGRYKVGGEAEDRNTDIGNKISQIVNKTKSQRGYLMMIKREFYEEDQVKKQDQIDATDRQIQQGGYEAKGLDRGKAYGKFKVEETGKLPKRYEP